MKKMNDRGIERVTGGLKKIRKKTKEKKFKVCFWNIAGTKEQKKRCGKKLKSWVKKMLIVGLVETRELKDDKWEGDLEKFECRSIKSEKEHWKGRAKAGVVMAVKEGEDRKITEWKKGGSKGISGVKIKRGEELWLFIVVYMKKEKQRNYETLQK